MNSNIALAGYYGMQNFGDDLFALIGIEGAKEFWPGHKMSVVGPPIKGVEAQYTVSSTWAANSYSKVSKTGQLTRLATTVAAAMSHQRYVYCGGSLFSAGTVGTRRFTDRIAGRDLSAIGVSIGPFGSSSDETAVKRALKKLEFLAVRDRKSYEIAQSFSLNSDVVLAADLAGLLGRYLPFLLESRSQWARKKKGGLVRIGLSLCNYSEKGQFEQENLCVKFAAAVACLQSIMDVEVSVICVNAHHIHGDARLSHIAAKHLQSAGIRFRMMSHGTVGIIGTAREISSLDCYVSARLHGAVTAYMSHVPVIVHQHHRKLVDFADDIGLNPIFRYTEESDLFYSICEALKDTGQQSKSINKFASEAMRNFTCAPWRHKAQSHG